VFNLRDMIYKLNYDSIVFLSSDAQERHRTIAYDWKNDKILEISSPLYHLLKKIFTLGQVDKNQLEELISSFGSDAEFLKKAIADLINREIIIKNGH